MVYATDGVTPAIASVGDVITSKAWKKKRASDVVRPPTVISLADAL